MDQLTIPIITLIVVCIIIPVALLLDGCKSNRLDKAIADWADNHGYQILELKPCTNFPPMKLGDFAQARPHYMVKVIDPEDRTLWFLVKTGVYFVSGSMRRLQTLMVDPIVTA